MTRLADTMIIRDMLRLRLLVALAVLSVLILPARAADNAFSSEWIDRIWFSHLLKRAQDLQDNPVASEAFFRDAFRVNARSADNVEALARMYVSQGEDAMAAMAGCYGRMLDPGRDYWNELDKTVWPGIGKAPEKPEVADDAATRLARYRKDFDEAKAAWDGRNFLNMELALRRQLSEYPRHPQLLLELAGGYAASSDWPMYTIAYSYFHRLHTNSLDVANNYAIGLERLGLYKEALAVLSPFLERDKKNAYLLDNCSRFAELAGMSKDAEWYAQRWIESASESVPAIQAYAKALLRRKALRDVPMHLEKASALDPANPVTVALYAHLYAVQEQDKSMIDALFKLKGLVDDQAFREVIASEPFKGMPSAVKLLEAP